MILTEVVMNPVLMQGTPVKNIADTRHSKLELTLAPFTFTSGNAGCLQS